jgi:hypothetical protein
MSDINKGYTFTDKSTDWASNKETAIRLNKMLDDAKINLVAGTNITITPTPNGPSISASGGGTGTVTSVNLTAGTSISVSGGPITTSGSITVNNTAPDQVVSLTGAGTTTVTGTYPNFTVSSADSATGTVTSVAATAGTGISVSGSPITTSGTLNITNTAPDQTVSLTGAGTTSITGTYPNFTVTSNDAFTGTVTAVTGTAPIVSSGGTTPAISINAATTLLPGSMSAADKAKLDAATNANTANAIVSRDVSGNFNAGTITANITGNISGSSGSTTGNAATATALQTARAINGVNFDGTAAITVTAAGSTLSDTVPIGKGGTGQTTANTAFNALAPSQAGNSGKYLTTDGSNTSWAAVSGGAGGTVTSVSVTTANGVSGVVATPTITPAITLTLGAITPTSVAATGAVSGSNLSGTNTGDQTNISGNAATVTTNANLTGPITSVGNATSVASQTGTGSTFVMQASPTLTTPALGTPTSGLLNSCTSNPSGTGAVPRTFQARAGDVFNVKDFGATGDGSTNDHAAIAAADSAANTARGVLVFPAGTFYVATSLTLISSPQFEGGALSIASGQTVTFNQAVVAPVQRLFYGSGTVRMAFRGAKCPVEWWGAGTGTESIQVDDRAFIQAAFNACQNVAGGDIFSEVIFSRQYWLSDEIVVEKNIGIDTNSASALFSKTTGGTGKGLRIQGPFDVNRIWNLPNFSGFTVFALKVDRANTARINIGLISGSGFLGDGIAVGCNTLGGSTLDNIFNVNVIAECKSAIRIYSNVDKVEAPLATIEGNEFNVNFVNNNVNGVVFDSIDDYTLPVATYTKGSAWDCNIFNIVALDAHAGVRRGFWYRATGLQYSQNVFRVPAWFGNFDSNGIWIDTSAATKSTFEIGVRAGEQMTSYNQLNLRGSGNTLVINGSGNVFGDQLAPDTFTALTSSGRSSFNVVSGVATPVPRNRMKVNFTLPANRAFGDTQTFYIYSPLVDGYSNRLRVSFIDSGGFIVNNLYDNSNVVANEIVVVFQNASGVTRSSGFTISAWVEVGY